MDVVAIFRVLFIVWLVLKLLELIFPEVFQPCPPEQQKKIGAIIRKVFGSLVRKEEREELVGDG